MRLRSRRGGNQVAGFDRQPFLAPAIFARAVEHIKQFVHDVMTVKRERFLSGRHHMQRATDRLQPEHRPDATPFDCKRAAVAAISEWYIGKVDNRPSAHPTLPSSETEISFCASTANSMGSCCSTSLTKPLTTSA